MNCIYKFNSIKFKPITYKTNQKNNLHIPTNQTLKSIRYFLQGGLNISFPIINCKSHIKYKQSIYTQTTCVNLIIIF